MIEFGSYPVILADPCWFYNDRYNIHNSRFGGGAFAQYGLMRDEDLAALPVDRLATKDAILFCWATGPKINEGVVHRVIDAWGFVPKNYVFVWEKTNRDGSPWYGTGFYCGGNAEFVIIATRNKGGTLKPAMRPNQIVRAPHPTDPVTKKKIHSAKPREVRDRIDLMYPNLKKLELFARDCQPGWDATGLDYDGKDIRDLLAEVAGEKRKAA